MTLTNVCTNCGYGGGYVQRCPECGSTRLLPRDTAARTLTEARRQRRSIRVWILLAVCASAVCTYQSSFVLLWKLGFRPNQSDAYRLIMLCVVGVLAVASMVVPLVLIRGKRRWADMRAEAVFSVALCAYCGLQLQSVVPWLRLSGLSDPAASAIYQAATMAACVLVVGTAVLYTMATGEFLSGRRVVMVRIGLWFWAVCAAGIIAASTLLFPLPVYYVLLINVPIAAAACAYVVGRSSRCVRLAASEPA